MATMMAGTASTTIPLRKETAERLGALRVPGLTYDDVVNFLLDRVPEAEVRKLFEEWQAAALARLQADPRVKPGKQGSRRRS